MNGVGTAAAQVRIRVKDVVRKDGNARRVMVLVGQDLMGAMGWHVGTNYSTFYHHQKHLICITDSPIRNAERRQFSFPGISKDARMALVPVPYDVDMPDKIPPQFSSLCIVDHWLINDDNVGKALFLLVPRNWRALAPGTFKDIADPDIDRNGGANIRKPDPKRDVSL